MLKEKIHQIMQEDYSYIIYSPDLNINMRKDSEKNYNPASIIKLFILYGALKKIDHHQANYDDLLNITQEDIVPGSGVLKDMHTASISLIDCLTLMITVSDNTATNLVLDYITIPYIQNTIDAVGIKNTYVRRKLYHLIPGVFNETIPEDVFRILSAFYEGTGLTKESQRIALDILEKQHYHYLAKNLSTCGACGQLLESNTCTCGVYVGEVDPVDVKMYSKTGEITGHVHEAGIMMIQSQPIYIVIMTAKQMYNPTTTQQISQVGKMIYTYAKDITC